MPTYTLTLSQAYSIPLSGISAAAWTNLSNVFVADGSFTTESNVSGYSQFLQVQTVSAPPTFSVNEQLVQVDMHVVRKASVNGAGFPPEYVQDNYVYLVKGGAALNSINYAKSGGWPTTNTDQTYTINQADLGTLGVTISDVGNTLGVAFYVNTVNFFDGSPIAASVDAVYLVITTQYVGGYVENPHVALSMAPTETDTYSSGGAHHYNDVPAVALSMAPTEHDTYVSPSNDYFASVSLGMFPSVVRQDGPFSYQEGPTVSLGLAPGGTDVSRPFEVVGSALTLTLSETDVYASASDYVYYDFPGAALTIAPTCTDHYVAADRASVSAGFGEAATNHAPYVATVAVGLHEIPSEHDAVAMAFTTSVGLSETPSESDKIKAKESASVSSSSTPSATGHSVLHDTSNAPIRLVASEHDSVGFVVPARVSQYVVPGSSDHGSFTSSPSVSLSESPTAGGKGKYKDSTGVSLGLLAAVSNPGKASAYTTSVGLSCSPRAIDTLTHAESVSVALSAKPSVTIPAMAASGLVPSIRYHVASTIEGLSNILEGLPQGTLGDNRDIPLPFGCIVVHAPTYRDAAVQSLQVDVQADVVIAMRETAGLDTAQALREAFVPFIKAMLDDFKQTGRTGVPSALYTYVQATPMDRQSEYQKFFSDSRGEPCVVQSATFTFACEGFG